MSFLTHMRMQRTSSQYSKIQGFTPTPIIKKHVFGFLNFFQNKHKSSCTNNRMKLVSGFTLIEILITIAIIAFLASVIFPSLQQARAKARLAKNQVFANSVSTVAGFTEQIVSLDLRTQLLSGLTIGASALSVPIPPYSVSLSGIANNLTWSNDTPLVGGYSMNAGTNQLLNANMNALDLTTDGVSMGVWVKPTASDASFNWSLRNSITNLTIINFVYSSSGLTVNYNYLACGVGCSQYSTFSGTEWAVPLLSRLNINEWNYLLFTIKNGTIEVWVNGEKRYSFTNVTSPGSAPIVVIDPGLTSLTPVFQIVGTNLRLFNVLVWQDYFNPVDPGRI